MKKFLLFLIMACTIQAKAQVPNPGFEDLNWDGSVSNWGNVYLWAISIDTNGVQYMDSIVFDNQLYFITNDAHSGTNAMEMRNAYNYTQNLGISGSVSSDSDSVYSSWSSFEMVPIATQPTQLEFFYKYFPVNGDVAGAKLQVFDNMGDIIGEANVDIATLATTYTYASAPVVYTVPAVAAYYALNFRTAIYGSTASFGTRFIVDDVSIDSPTGLNDIASNNSEINIFPNPAKDVLNISTSSYSQSEYKIYDQFGRLVKDGLLNTNMENIAIDKLSDGFYTIELSKAEKRERAGFIILK